MIGYLFSVRPSHGIHESRPSLLLTEAAFIYNQKYRIKLSFKYLENTESDRVCTWHLQ